MTKWLNNCRIKCFTSLGKGFQLIPDSVGGKRGEVRGVNRVMQYQVRESETPTLEDIPLDYS